MGIAWNFSSWHVFVCCVLWGWKGIWQAKEWNLGSIIKTYSKRERKKFIYIYAEMMMMCFISYVSSHGVKKIILLLYNHDVSKLFDVCLMGWKKVDIFFPAHFMMWNQVCNLMFFNHYSLKHDYWTFHPNFYDIIASLWITITYFLNSFNQ